MTTLKQSGYLAVPKARKAAWFASLHTARHTQDVAQVTETPLETKLIWAAQDVFWQYLKPPDFFHFHLRQRAYRLENPLFQMLIECTQPSCPISITCSISHACEPWAWHT